MTFRTGTKDGPARAIDVLGILGGFLAPLIIATYVIFGGLWINGEHNDADRETAANIATLLEQSPGSPDLESKLTTQIGDLKESDRFEPVAAKMTEIVEAPGALTVGQVVDLRELNNRVVEDAHYSHVHQMMSDLGDRHDALGIWFLVVNVAVGVCLLLFTFAVFRRVPVGRWVVLLLAVTAVMSATLGLSRCQQSCDLTTTNVRDNVAHDVASLALLILIILIPALAASDLPTSDRTGVNGDQNLSRLRTITRWLPQLAIFPAVGTLISLQTGSYAGLFQRLTWGVGYVFVIAVSVEMFRSRRGFARRPFDVRRVQENVLYGSASREHGRYVLGWLVQEREAQFRKNLRDAIDAGVIRAETRRPRTGLVEYRPFTVTVGVTAEGLKAMGQEHRWMATGPDAFAEGMRARSDVLGEYEFQDPWGCEPHLVLWITGTEAQLVEKQVTSVTSRFGDSVKFERLPDCRIGLDNRVLRFADGLSNPWIVDVHSEDDARRQGGGKLTADGKWERLALGEFVLGELDETRDVFPVPEPTAVFNAGTFLVLRQLQVHEKAFQHLVDAGVEMFNREQSIDPTDQGVSQGLVAAKMMGRDYEGAPLATSLDGASGSRNNTFSYADDPEGFGCPLGAHVRRANPRDSLGFEGVPAHRRRIIRRGMPYQQGNEKGLMFAAFNVRIADQFEFIQRQWLDDGDAFRLGAAPDPIAGRRGPRTTHFTWHTEDGPGRVALRDDQPIVTPVGGAYFLVPSMDGLRAIAKD